MSRKIKLKPPFDIDKAVDQIIELGVRRKQFIKARIRVMNAAGALIRRALGWNADMEEAASAALAKVAARILAVEDPKTLPDEHMAIATALWASIATAREMAKPGEVYQHQVELEMRRIARSFPVWEWAKGVYGLSDLGLAVIIAEAGDLSKYSDPGKLRKRLGLAPFQKDGVTRAYSQWRKEGGLTSDDWISAGYSPKRRASIYSQVGACIIGGMGKGYRPFVGEDIEQNPDLTYYEKVFVHRLRYLAERDPKMRRPDTKEGKESYSKHAAFDATRYTEQRLLKHLWQAWRRTIGLSAEKPNEPVSDAQSIAA